jgi:hypothetical protein
MGKYRLPCLVAVGIVLSILARDEAFAQDPAPGQRGTGFGFSYSVPGARALGMGNTFIAFADDVTAADANPAGLAALEAAEVSGNLKFTSFKHDAAVDFTGRIETFDDTVTSPVFFGFAVPFEGAAVSVFYQQNVNRLSHSSFDDNTTPIFFICCSFLVDEQVSIETVVQTFGGSVAYNFEDIVAVGATIGFASLDWEQSRILTLTDFDFPLNSVTLDINLEEVESRATTFNLGVLINPGGNVSAGAVYKRGAEFELSRSLTPTCIGFTGDLCIPANFTTDTHALVLPSVFGGGIAFRHERFRVGADIVQVSYSDLADSFEFIAGFPSDEPIEDQIEVHAGAEYGFGDDDAQGAVRAGIFTSPDHDGVRFVDSDVVGFAFGAGGTIEGVMLDGAVSFSKAVTEFLFSFGYSFR